MRIAFHCAGVARESGSRWAVFRCPGLFTDEILGRSNGATCTTTQHWNCGCNKETRTLSSWVRTTSNRQILEPWVQEEMRVQH